MRDFTLEQLLEAWATARDEVRFAPTASRIADVERRRENGNATMARVVEELKRRVDRRKAS
jgi:hypothetical protein